MEKRGRRTAFAVAGLVVVGMRVGELGTARPTCLRALAGLLVVWMLAVASALSAFGSPVKVAPNILFLLSDDQRFDTIRALGNREIETPNLDRLVHNGFSFTHAHIMGAMQGAVCVPSRAMILTGRTLFHATVFPGNNALPPAARLWPEVLRQAGYTSLGVGKWHNDQASFVRAFDGGGPVFFGGMADHRKIPVFDFDPEGRYPKSLQYTGAVFDTELFADAACKLIREKRDQPFCLYVAFTSPHDPRTPPERFARMYPPENISLPRNFLPEHPFDNGDLRGRDERLLPWPRTLEAVRKEIALYYGMISHLDEQLGRILAALEETGQTRQTLVIFAGDNGLAVGQHGLLGKQNLYEHSVRVPLIFSGPGIPKGKRSDAPCYLLDVFPTICDLAGVAIPDTVEGKSLRPVIIGKEKKVRDVMFGAYRDLQRMACDNRWKLIYYPKANRTQLFDLEKDPDETSDLSADPKCADKLYELRAKLTALQQEVGDPLIRGPLESAKARSPAKRRK